MKRIEDTMIDVYGEIIEKLEDEEIKNRLSYIQNSEKVHSALADEMIEIEKNNPD